MSEYRLIVLTKPMAHHGQRAGYNVLTRYLQPDLSVRANTTFAGRLTNAVTRRLMNRVTGVVWYGGSALLAEARAAAAARWWDQRGERTVVHVLYGEDLLWAAPRLVGRPRTRLVATFHQPPDRLRGLVRRRDHLRELDALIALDPNNAAELERDAPGRVHTLSLGVDDVFWAPGAPRPRDRVLFVGNHLRDFALLSAVVQRLGPEGVGFDLVVPRHRVAPLLGLPNATVRTGISDEDLRDLYRRACVFFLPLVGASANNAVMQALACGAPIVATELPGVVSYVPPAAGVFAPPGDVEAHATLIRQIFRSRAQVAQMSEAARAHSATLSWSHVARRHRALYKSLLRP